MDSIVPFGLLELTDKEWDRRSCSRPSREDDDGGEEHIGRMLTLHEDSPHIAHWPGLYPGPSALARKFFRKGVQCLVLRCETIMTDRGNRDSTP